MIINDLIPVFKEIFQLSWRIGKNLISLQSNELIAHPGRKKHFTFPIANIVN